MRKAALHNLGCKVNAYETEAMQELLEKNGYQIVPFQDEADIYIINTCSVTNIADRKSRQMIHRARKQNPDAVIVAAGCYVQARTDAGEKDENIDIVIGNNKKQELIGILDAYFAQKEKHQQIEVIDINHTAKYEELSLTRTAEHTRAYLKVQDGCNQFCTYCIIPYARGRVRSRKKEEVVREVETLAANGYREVVLTGIHLSSYGVDLKDENGKQQEDLLSLIRAVHEVEGIVRIRLGSLEPRIITEEFASELSKLKKICPHFHLSLQSGCNATLKRMNRRYSAEEYYEKCRILRKYFDNPALTTDVITGFPGETEEDFLETMDVVKQVEYDSAFTFIYSKRTGTPAAAKEEQVPEEIVKDRFDRLLQVVQKIGAEKAETLTGTRQKVLVEDVNAQDEQLVTGRLSNNSVVHIRGGKELIGQIVEVTLDECRGFYYMGTLV